MTQHDFATGHQTETPASHQSATGNPSTFDPVAWVRRAKRMGYRFQLVLLFGDRGDGMAITNVLVHEPDPAKVSQERRARARRTALWAEINSGTAEQRRRRWEAASQRMNATDALVVHRKRIEPTPLRVWQQANAPAPQSIAAE